MSENNSIYIYTRIELLNSAYANRLICTAKGLVENGQDVTVLNLGQIDDFSPFTDNAVKYISLSKFKNKYLQLIASLINGRKYVRTNNIIIFHLTTYWFLKWFLFFKKKDTKIFHERTEFPNLNVEKSIKKYNKLCSKFDGIFVISNAIGKYFTNVGVDENKIYRFPMLIEPCRFENIQKTETEKSIAYCGDMGGNKDGLFDLIEAFYIFHKQRANVKLYLIGDAKNKVEFKNIQNRVIEKGLDKYVIFTGCVGRDEIPLYLKNASVLVLVRPNNYQSQGGFPTKLGEYLATGNPVVITRTGEIDHYLTDNKDCFFVEPNNSIAFAEKVQYVFENYDLAKKVGIEGNRKVYTDFNYKVQTQKLIEFINNKL